MNHWRARRHLAAVPDHTLSPDLEARVLAHTRNCASCRRVLHEHWASERLLQRIPASMIPLGIGADAALRLAGLTRWAPEAAPVVGRWRAPALGVVAVLVAVLLQLSLVLPVTPGIATAEPWIEVSTRAGEPATVGGMAGWR
ncbi:MAG: zf-HC2 domain-containing protein [Deltaproteobacteria bacterium]|nr:MAG: zf-HC2 domain-containing protein [Deltaproteobacteria bacterium]